MPSRPEMSYDDITAFAPMVAAEIALASCVSIDLGVVNYLNTPEGQAAVKDLQEIRIGLQQEGWPYVDILDLQHAAKDRAIQMRLEIEAINTSNAEDYNA